MSANPQAPDLTVAAYIARFLRQQGIRRYWGVTGGENVDLINACYAEGVEFQLVHHENTAAFLAQNTATLTGTPAVFLTTLGPGATNIINAVADAYLARLPLIAITADFEDPAVEFATHQNAPLPELLRPITKWNVRLTPANVAEALAYAWGGGGARTSRTGASGVAGSGCPPNTCRRAVAGLSPAARHYGCRATVPHSPRATDNLRRAGNRPRAGNQSPARTGVNCRAGGTVGRAGGQHAHEQGHLS